MKIVATMKIVVLSKLRAAAVLGLGTLVVLSYPLHRRFISKVVIGWISVPSDLLTYILRSQSGIYLLSSYRYQVKISISSVARDLPQWIVESVC